MGNRAVITGKNANNGIYLHWNGGRDSVEAFLAYCDLLQLPGLDGQDSPGLPGLITIITNFFGNNGLSVSLINTDIDNLELLSPGDNGIYIVEGWTITKRIQPPQFEQDHHDRQEMLHGIDRAQPQQLGDYIDAPEVPTSSLKPGDSVYLTQFRFEQLPPEARPILGLGEQGKIVNATDVTGLPYVDRYGNSNPENNINNYIRTPTIKLASK